MTFRRMVMLGAVLSIPALAIAQKVTYDYDKSANFTQFKTYMLKDGTKVGNPLVDDRITASLRSELAAKGLTEAADADVAVVYHVAFDKQKDISAWTTGRGPYRWGGWGTADVRVNDILVGTLVIDVADVKKGELVWRGIGVKEVDPQAKPDKRDKNIQQAVQKIMRNYPPPRKKTT
jgi:hypothetical protein